MEQPDCESDGLGEKKLMLALLWCALCVTRRAFFQ
jgi:hypothetical protein